MTTKLRERQELVFFRYLSGVRAPMAAAWWLLIALRGALPAVFTVATGMLITGVQEGRQLLLPMAVVATTFVLIQVLAPLHAQLSSNLGERLSNRLHGVLAEATTSPSGISHLESPELTDRLVLARDFDLGLSGPPMTISVGLITGGLVEATAGLAQAVVLCAYHPWAAVLVAGAWLSTHWFMRDSSSWDRDTEEVLHAQRTAEYDFRLAVNAPAAKELRIFGLSEWTVARFAVARRRLIDLRWQATRLRQRSVRRAVTVLVIANGLVFWALATDATSGAISLGDAVMFVQAALGASALAFGGLNWALPPSAESVRTVLRLREDMRKAGALPSAGRSAKDLPSVGIRLRDVHFCYPHSSRPVFDGLDLTIEAGTSLAIVGVNGAGKTTLAKILCRLYDPTSGAVEVDGVDLRDLDVDSWRQRVAAVFQDFVRYHLPLRDNVAPNGAPEELVQAALQEAGAEDLADLDTVLARGYEGGTDLSGGQWQRVALARALAGVRLGADLVILDEPTAQLDIRGEAEIFERILDATRGITTVLISHRFSTVRHANLICVLEEGRVVELGSHAELMTAKGRYHSLYSLQASRFNAPEESAQHTEEIQT
ncbi:ABC transporter ATP-binding protein [Streptomyces sp. NPDC005283]|uniref:ABC transporter ATP-binding protein n=1 Tax=Streptomyces sp. NPDC005283 TaxID=3156871 RepID=UPI003452923B